jgi:hypothetical protein
VIQRSTGYTISGTASSASGTTNLRVSVRRLGDEGSENVHVETQEGGRFVARGVTPGKYRVSAVAGEGAGLFESSAPERAGVVVEVGATDVSGVELVATKGASLTGRIVPVEALPAGAKLRVAHTLGFTDADEGEWVLYQPAPVRGDLTFELSGVRGKVLFQVEGLPDGWAVMSVRYRGADVTDTSVAVTTTTDPRDLEIHVSPRSGQIIARPTDAEKRPMAGAFAMLFAAAGDRIFLDPFGGMQKVRDGVHDLGHVRPGTYRVVALKFTDLLQLSQTPARFAALRELGQVVTVAAGQQLTVDVVVQPLPENR